jgi:hypothetical protein
MAEDLFGVFEVEDSEANSAGISAIYSSKKNGFVILLFYLIKYLI